MKKLTNISKAQKNALGVQALADRPNANLQYGVAGLSATQLKKWFDQLAFLLVDKINGLQNAISGEDAADYIRIPLFNIKDTDGTVVEGSLQDLVTSISDGKFADKLMYEDFHKNLTPLNTFLQNLSKDVASAGCFLAASTEGKTITIKLLDKDKYDVLSSISFDIVVKTSDQIGNSVIKTEHIINGAVTGDKIDGSAITENKIDTGAVTENKIADDAVTTNKIAGSAITEDKIDTGAVTSEKVADGAINDYHIKDGAINSYKLAPFSVTNDNIVNNQISRAKLNSELKGIIDDGFKDVSYDAKTGVLTFTTGWANKTKTVDLPLELIVNSGGYDNTPGEEAIVLILANGSNIRIPLTDISEKLADNIADVKKSIGVVEDSINTVNKKTTKLEYKYLFSRDASIDGFGDGYVEIEVPANCVIEVSVNKSTDGPEFHNDYFKLYCNNNEHDNHKVLENASNQKVYTINSSNQSPCYWYIPYPLYSEMDSIAVYARSANENSIVINAKWVDSVEDLIEVPDYYALYSDCKFDMLTENRGDKPLQTGTWVCVHTGGVGGFKLLNRNGNAIYTHQGYLPDFEFGIVTISVPWLESYWSAFAPDRTGYNKIHCSLIAKVGNEMKCYYWEDSGNGTHYLRDISAAGNGMCWKIG